MTSSVRETRWCFHFNPEVGSRIAGYVYSHVQLGLYSSLLYVYGKRQQWETSVHVVLALIILYTSQVLLLLLLSICFYRSRISTVSAVAIQLRRTHAAVLLFSFCFRKVLASQYDLRSIPSAFSLCKEIWEVGISLSKAYQNLSALCFLSWKVIN